THVIVSKSADGRDSLSQRLDEDKIDQLRRWGAGLAQADGDELRATGKAILMLIEEIEALHVDLWSAKRVDVDLSTDADSGFQPDLHRTLAERLRFGRGRARGEA